MVNLARIIPCFVLMFFVCLESKADPCESHVWDLDNLPVDVQSFFVAVVHDNLDKIESTLKGESTRKKTSDPSRFVGPRVVDKKGRGAFHYVCSAEAVKLLREFGANPLLEDEFRWKPIDLAKYRERVYRRELDPRKSEDAEVLRRAEAAVNYLAQEPRRLIERSLPMDTAPSPSPSERAPGTDTPGARGPADIVRSVSAPPGARERSRRSPPRRVSSEPVFPARVSEEREARPLSRGSGSLKKFVRAATVFLFAFATKRDSHSSSKG